MLYFLDEAKEVALKHIRMYTDTATNLKQWQHNYYYYDNWNLNASVCSFLPPSPRLKSKICYYTLLSSENHCVREIEARNGNNAFNYRSLPLREKHLYNGIALRHVL